MTEPPATRAALSADGQRRHAALLEAAARRPPTEVEAALGWFRRGDIVGAARAAAGAALRAGRWDNLSYLADFLRDVAAPHPPAGGASSSGSEEGGPPDEGSEEGGGPPCGCATGAGLLGFVVPVAGPAGDGAPAVRGLLVHVVRAARARPGPGDTP